MKNGIRLWQMPPICIPCLDRKVAFIEDDNFFAILSRSHDPHILGADHEIDVDHWIIEGVFRVRALAIVESSS